MCGLLEIRSWLDMEPNMVALSDECHTRVRGLIINECHIPKATLRKICYHDPYR